MRLRNLSLIASLSLFLASCGTATLEDNVSGSVVDGYIENATVFIDLNDNGVLDSDEPNTKTSFDGSYLLKIPANIDYKNKKIIAFDGIDKDTNTPYTGKLYNLALENNANLTPLSTIFTNLVDQGLDPKQAKEKIKLIYNLPENVDVLADPIVVAKTTNDKILLETNLALHKALDTLTLALKKDYPNLPAQELIDKGFKALSYVVKDNNTHLGIENSILEIANNTKAKELLSPKAINTLIIPAKVASVAKKEVEALENVDELQSAVLKTEIVKDEYEKLFNQDDFDFNVTKEEFLENYNIEVPKTFDEKIALIQEIINVSDFEALQIKLALEKLSLAITKENIEKVQNEFNFKSMQKTLYAPKEVILSLNDQNILDKFDLIEKLYAKGMDVTTLKESLKTEIQNSLKDILTNTFGTTSNFSYHIFENFNAISLKSDTFSALELVDKLKQNTLVKEVFPNFAQNLDDDLDGNLWAVENTGQIVNGESGTYDADMDIKEAWEKTQGDSGVVVAVIDTGVDYKHEDLKDSMQSIDEGTYGYDFAGDDDGNNDEDPMPDTPYRESGHYHGTHVAGIIASSSNGIGITGVAPKVKILALKVFRPNGSGYLSDILEAYDFVANKKEDGLNIVAVNASYGSYSQTDVEKDAIEKLNDLGVVFVAASGNDSKDTDEEPHYPSSYDVANIISVAASDQDDKLASFSNYGKNSVDVAAPGVNILAPIPPREEGDEHDDYAYLNGTSMATPQITGTVALLKSKYPNLTIDDVKKLIIDNVDVKDDFQNKVVSNGRANTLKALEANEQNTAPVANDDSASVEVNQEIIIDVLANDEDENGDALEIVSVGSASLGSVVIENNKLKYTAGNSAGEDNFSYTISDGKETSSANVKVVVTEDNSNSAPKAYDDSAKVSENSEVTIDVLANDEDVDGDNLNIVSVTTPSNGQAKIEDNKITYIPNTNYYGEDSFYYTISDGELEDSAKVSVYVEKANTAPVANDDSASTSKNTSVEIDVLDNDSDPDADSFSINNYDRVSKYGGSVEKVSSGWLFSTTYKLKYTPKDGFVGTDTFTYDIVDENGAVSKKAVVSVEVKDEDTSSSGFGWFF